MSYADRLGIIIILASLVIIHIILGLILPGLINPLESATSLTPEQQSLLTLMKSFQMILPAITTGLFFAMFIAAFYPERSSGRSFRNRLTVDQISAAAAQNTQTQIAPVTQKSDAPKEKKPVPEEHYHNRFEAILDEE